MSEFCTVPVSPSVCLSVCLSACVSVSPPICLSVSPPICLSVCLSVYLSICLSVCLLPDCLLVCLSVCLFPDCLPACRSICHSVCRLVGRPVSLNVCLSLFFSCLLLTITVCPSVLFFLTSLPTADGSSDLLILQSSTGVLGSSD